MYSINLATFSLDEFYGMLISIDLLPGRKILLNNIQGLIEKLKARNIHSLSELQKMIEKKTNYPALSKELSVEEEYLTVLNREINSYVSKPLVLNALELLTKDEIASLAALGINNTKNFYDRTCKKTDRKKVVSGSIVPECKLTLMLQFVDLLRVNGIGPVYAKILNAIGIKSKDDYLSMPSQTILTLVQEANQEKGYIKVKLGLKDIEYCKRFCLKLDSDIYMNVID